jgi:predicted unusual protein kinase regulating ubiquinone biosynthesis (AarF/ABC1/UbiB family)
MDWWLWVLLVLSALISLYLGFALRSNRANITTRMGGRVSRVGGLAFRASIRRLRYAVRQIFSNRRRRRELKKEFSLKTAEEAAQVMGQMKGVFMKIGQIVSFAHDAIDESAQEALRSLQQGAPPMSFDLFRGVVEAELGQSLETLFDSVDETPLAAASIGQVHRAKLKEGHEVVLKVQYPGVDEAITNDLRFARGIISMIDAIYPNADGKAVVAELKERLSDELNYELELQNQALFADLWKGHPLVHIPKVYPAYSSRRVLCQEFVEGLNFYDFLEVATKREKEVAVYVLNDFVFDSMHRFHVFNGDPHPGNYIFHSDGRVTFLDFGCVKFFDGAFINHLQGLNRSIVEKDMTSFEHYIRALDIVLPGRPYDQEFLWSFFEYHAAPFAQDAVFSFSPEYLSKARDVMNPKDLRKLNLPPNLLFFNRITFGLNAIFQKLDASANFHQLYRRYTFPKENRGPAVALVRDDLSERFTSAEAAPVTGPPR